MCHRLPNLTLPIQRPLKPIGIRLEIHHGLIDAFSRRLNKRPILHDLLVELIRAAGPPGFSDFTRVSADDGVSWTALRPLPIGSSARLVLPQFEDSSHWSLAAGRLLWRTSDAGKTWQPLPAAILASLSVSDFQVVGHNVMWAVAARDETPDAYDRLLRRQMRTAAILTDKI